MEILPRRPGTITGSTCFISQSVANAIIVVVTPSRVWPPPKHRPMTVTSHNVAAVVSPRTISPRRRIAPAPMKPMPDRMPSGRRIMSRRRIDICVSVVWTTNQLASIIAAVAATETRMVVRRPAGWACPPRSSPTRKPAVKPSARRNRTCGPGQRRAHWVRPRIGADPRMRPTASPGGSAHRRGAGKAAPPVRRQRVPDRAACPLPGVRPAPSRSPCR